MMVKRAMFDVVGLKQRFNVCACMMRVCMCGYVLSPEVVCFPSCYEGKPSPMWPVFLQLFSDQPPQSGPEQDPDKRPPLTWLSLFLSYLNSHSLCFVSQDLMVCAKTSQRKKMFWSIHRIFMDFFHTFLIYFTHQPQSFST